MTTQKYYLSFSCFLLFFLGFLSGCGPSSQIEGLVPASGVVFYDGTPVAQATVIFSPTFSGKNARPVSATTDEKGHFSMMTLNPGDGAFPGEYVVTIAKTEQMGEPKKETMPDGKVVERGRTDERIREMLPVKYKEAKTSGLTITIPEKGDKNIEFKLEGTIDDAPKLPSGPSRRR